MIMEPEEAKTAATLLAPRLKKLTHVNDHSKAIRLVSVYFAPAYKDTFAQLAAKAEKQLHVTQKQADASYRLSLVMWDDIRETYGDEIASILRAAL